MVYFLITCHFAEILIFGVRWFVPEAIDTSIELREQGRRKRGRPRLRWEDCVRRDVRKAGEEEDWKKTRDRGGWKRLSDEAVKNLRAAPHS